MASNSLIVFIMLLFYLILHTGFASMMILDKEGINVNSVSLDLSNIVPLVNSGFNNSVVNQSIHGAIKYSGIWTLNSDGSYTLSALDSLTTRPPTLVIDNILSQNGIYTNEYNINNAPLTEFGIIIRRANTDINYLDNIVLMFGTDRIYIPSNIIGDDFSLPISGLLSSADMKIKTVFNSKNGNLDIYLNDNLIAQAYDLHGLSLLSMSHYYYCGVQSFDVGFTWNSVTTVIGIEQESSFIGVGMQFFNTVWSLYNFTMPSEYYPIPLMRVILFDLPLIGLLVFAIMIFRGV